MENGGLRIWILYLGWGCSKYISYLDLLEAERALTDVVAGHERVVDDDARLHEEVVVGVDVLVEVLLVALLAWHFAADCVLAEVELGVVSDQFKKCLPQVNFRFECRFSLLLQKADYHKEESVGAQTASICIVETPHLEHLLKNENQWLNQLALRQVALNQIDARQTIMVLRPERDVNINRLAHDSRIARH